MANTVILRQVQDMLEAAQAPGAVVSLMVDGQVWSEDVGHEDLNRMVPLAASSRFGVYSVTKTVIATIVMKLVESGLVSLDAAVQDFLPDVPVVEPVTVRQLLNHTGGVPNYGGLADYHEDVRLRPSVPWTEAQFLERTLESGLLFEPGTGWQYSNVGYMLLRLMIERVAGGSFGEAVGRYAAEPLGVPNIGVADSLAAMAELTPGYTGEPKQNIIPRYHPGWVSHGLVTSTASDLARFLDALMTGALVTEESLRQMLVAIPVGESHPWMTAPSYGAGLMIDTANRFGVVAGHTGGGPGYSTAAYHFPDVGGQRVTSVALVNRDGGDLATDIAFTMAQAFADMC